MTLPYAMAGGAEIKREGPLRVFAMAPDAMPRNSGFCCAPLLSVSAMRTWYITGGNHLEVSSFDVISGERTEKTALPECVVAGRIWPGGV